ncbi:hypothetical protein D5S17_14755 [Pseudonocardiaceae bacterium YIM PH 21723]|nr:hypothetical protein D5S17_14755 [Pseudonocardiaceae bacterium YIM PH 21723]
MAILLGLLLGLGLILICWALLPAAPVDLVAVLSRIDAHQQPSQPPQSHPLVRGATAYVSRSEHRLLRLPTADLALLGQEPTQFVARRLSFLLAGSVLGAVIALRAGTPLLIIPLVIGLGVAASLVPGRVTAAAAMRMRRDVRAQVATAFDLVAQERDAGRAPAQALQTATEIADSPVFTRLAATLREARHRGVPAWQALSELGRQIEVRELTDLSEVMATAADGAAVSTGLRDKAAALRSATRSDERAAANRRSELLVGPVALLVVGFLVLLLHAVLAYTPI